MADFNLEPQHLLLAGVAAALLPFLALMTTSFVKIAVVLSLVRNALGIQQIPPNMALYGLALILTMYIMAPVMAAAIALAPASMPSGLEESLTAVKSMAEPFRTFLLQHAEPQQLDFFHNTSKRLWPPELIAEQPEDSLVIAVPAFIVSELTAAFKIGFLLYLPFIAIDLIVSNILLAMGMMMVSPLTISLPLKLLLFVIIDGWSKLIQGLVLTYQ